jgi:hypothetical protein
MELSADFVFQPLPPIEPAAAAAIAPDAAGGGPLGQLANLSGSWSGQGFNVIWRPHHPGQDHFLELNVTTEEITFSAIPGAIPNRGLLQNDITMHGLSYLQQIQDTNIIVNGAPAGLHFEPGMWLNIPSTTDPKQGGTVARLASIPHGTTILAQGTAKTTSGPPSISDVSITPFSIGDPKQTIPFDESNLSKPSQFRTPPPGLKNVTQAMVNNPNSVLTKHAKPNIASTTTLHVFTKNAQIPGGGTANTVFLKGTADGANADAARVHATFWLQTPQGSNTPNFLQYSQVVLLNFAGLSWPHVTVGNLTRQSGP